MKVFVTALRICLLFMVFYSCNDNNKKDIIVKGVIAGLPDGMMYLKDIKLTIIDSCSASAGKFQFQLASDKYPEPIYAEMVHVAGKDSMFRSFQFLTNRKVKGYPVYRARFMLDQEGITMNGTIQDSFFSRKRYSSTIDGVVKFGRQTNILFADTFNFNGKIVLEKMKESILASPFSYHLLYNVERIKHLLSDKQLLSLLNCFNEDVQAASTASKMKSYISLRDKMKLNNTTFPDSAGKQHFVLDQKAKLNMVILWASWCGPCRAEIPQLKKVYKKFIDNEGFRMVSVSIDQENLEWRKAMKAENMPWKQLLTGGEKADYYKELFDVNSSIPTTLFYNSNGKLIKKYIGYNAENEVEVMGLITANLK